jgi:hypothetical protein
MVPEPLSKTMGALWRLSAMMDRAECSSTAAGRSRRAETVDDRDDGLRCKASTTIRVRGKKPFGGAEGNEAVLVGHFSPRVEERNAVQG